MTNNKTTKKALLSSVFALLMCVTMLIGTTFAWFTDTATTGVNKIQSGTLDVALEMWDGTNWVNVEGEQLDFVKAEAGEGQEILWEPGCTYELPKLRVVNQGNLALKFAVKITGIDGDAKLNEVIDWKISFPNAPFAAGTEYEFNVGVGASVGNASGEDGFCTLTPNASREFVIKGHMQESAGNEYQNLSIEGIAITVVATQATYEYDSTDRWYDHDAPLPSIWDGKTVAYPEADEEGVYHITNAAEFVGYIEKVGGATDSIYTSAKAVLDRDIDLNDYTIYRTGEAYIFAGEFDGQNHTVSNYRIERTDEAYYTGLFGYLGETNGHSGSVKNLIVKNATVIGAKQVGAIVPSVNDATSVENCHAYNCTVIGSKRVGSVVGYSAGSVKDCSATDCNVYASVAEEGMAGAVLGFNNGGIAEGLDAANVNVVLGAICVSTEAELKTALKNGGTVILMNDIELTSAWEPIKVSTPDMYTPIAESLIFNGGNHTISGLTAPLFAGAAVANLTVSNLTIADSEILGGGAIADYKDNTGAGILKMENCHVLNSTISAPEGSNAGGLVGSVWTSDLSIKGCSATNCTIDGGNAGGLIGLCQTETIYTDAIENCEVENCIITGEADNKDGAIIGTVNGNGTLVIKNCTWSGDAYGRVLNATVEIQ